MIAMKVYFILVILAINQSQIFSLENNLDEDFIQCLSQQHSKSKIIRRSDFLQNEYNEYNIQWNLRTYVLPVGYIDVQSTQDVQAAIICAKKLNIPLVAKSGGHSFEGYSYGNDNNHWVLDLRSLNQIKIDESQSIGTIGPGNKVYNLSTHLWDIGKVAIVNVRCPNVGFGGFSLGGGYGFISRKVGMAVDNILEMEVVTADGNILVANNTTNEDLFWALRGAGIGNFGVVTQFKVQLYKPRYIIASVYNNYSMKCFPTIFDQWQKWIASNPNPSISTSTIDIERSSNFGKFSLLIFIVEENSAKRDQLIAELRTTFPSIKEEDIRLHYYDQVNEADLKFASQIYIRSKSYYVKDVIDKESINQLYTAINLLPPQSKVWFDAYGGAINSRALDANAFVHREVLYNFGIAFGSATPVDLALTDQLLNLFIEKTKFLYSDESYQNYIDGRLENWQNYYYGQNFARLIEIKKKYDPTNFFKYKQSIPSN